MIMEIWIIFMRTVFIYFIIFAVLRLMGKREIGKLSIFDLIISVMIAEIAVFVIEDPDKPLIYGLMPMFVLVAIQIALSVVQLRSQRLRSLLEGKPSILIQNGQLDIREMKRQRYNLDDLLQQLREKDVAGVADVKFAILENSGKLSIFKNSETQSQLPLPLIMDGVVQTEHLQKLGKSQQWLNKKLQTDGVTNVQDVFYCALESEEPFRWMIQLKNED
jgi:uncharacterized membrane protein YcaP (DUF421 family)